MIQIKIHAYGVLYFASNRCEKILEKYRCIRLSIIIGLNLRYLDLIYINIFAIYVRWLLLVCLLVILAYIRMFILDFYSFIDILYYKIFYSSYLWHLQYPFLPINLIVISLSSLDMSNNNESYSYLNGLILKNLMFVLDCEIPQDIWSWGTIL